MGKVVTHSQYHGFVLYYNGYMSGMGVLWVLGLILYIPIVYVERFFRSGMEKEEKQNGNILLVFCHYGTL